jgi:PLP dependent protein
VKECNERKFKKLGIAEKFIKIREAVPSYVSIVLAAKTRTTKEVAEAIKAGAKDIGHNYVQEALMMYAELKAAALDVNFHLIGHLQTNKISKVLDVCNCIQTVDSYKKAFEINRRTQRPIEILLEINSAMETNKKGFLPNYVDILRETEKIVMLDNVVLKGVMTMGPFCNNPEDIRLFFRKTKDIFEKIKDDFPGENIDTLSMGMSDSYKIAIEEGSNMIRLGSIVFE